MASKWVWIGLLGLLCLGCGQSSATPDETQDGVGEPDGGSDALEDALGPERDGSSGDAHPDTVDGEEASEVDDAFVERGPGLEIDYPSVTAGVAPRYAPDEPDWTAMGWPNDRLRTPDGFIDLSSFPNPGFDILSDYLDYGSTHLKGFGLNGAVYISFEGAIDATTLPPVSESASDPLASVQLVNVTPGAVRYGEQVPLEFAFYGTGSDLYWSDNTLALRPLFGAVLAEGQTYCAVVTRKVRDADGHHLSRASVFAEVLFEEPTLASLVAWLSDSPLRSEDLATATCFTTQDATGELRLVRDYLDGREPPEVAFISEPLVFDEYHGTYLAPVFQAGDKPYADEGGGMVFDSDDRPVEQGLEEVRFLMMVPRDLPMPETGWPVMLYAHGTGGDYESCRNVDDELLPLGYALLCIDQPLHGTRGPDPAIPLDDGELVIYSFNFLNPGAGRTNFRQSAIDTMVLTRMVVAGRFDLGMDETIDGQGVSLDGERIAFFGHSHGGLSGAIVAGIDPLLDAVLLSGAGAILINTLLLRKDPVDLSLLVQAALGVGASYLDTFHPTMSLIQMMVDATDPVNYAPYWSTPDPGNTAKHVFITEGTLDVATPAITTETLAAAARIPLMTPISNTSGAHDVLGITSVEPPLSFNVQSLDGPRTAGLKQWEGGSHFVAFQRAEAEAMWIQFFKTYLDGEVVISTGDTPLYRAAERSPADSCADVELISSEAFPLSFVGNTATASDALQVVDCGGISSGAGQRDHVVGFEVETSGVYRFVLTRPVPRGDDDPPTGPDHLYAITDCEAPSDSCLSVEGDDELVIELTAGQSVYVVVDGSTMAHRGPYRLYASRTCESLSCEGRECGDWGCESCGTCATGQRCDAEGQCIALSTPGDLCSDAIEVGALPFIDIGSTLEASGDYAFSDGACPGEATGRGGSSADVAYRFVAPADDRFVLTLDTDFDGALYVVTDCDAIDATCLAARRRTSRSERLALDLLEGQAVTVIVDGAYNFSNQAGHYTLRIEACVPDCEGQTCGDDGCGGSCGACDALSVCASTTACVPFPFTCDVTAQCDPRPEGDVCENARIIDALPYTFSGSTTAHHDDADHGGCPGDSTGRGGASPDTHFVFSAPESALYRFTLSSNFDSVLYLSESCYDLVETCVAADQVSKKGGEEIFLPLDSGDALTVVVDGASNLNTQRGTYTLDVDICVPSCAGKACGSDGCGGSCGGCDSSRVCSGGFCLDKAGDSCADLRVLSDDLPSSDSEDTAHFDPVVSLGCLSDGAVTSASPDVYYRFKAPESGSYRFALEASFPVALAVLESCVEAPSTCLASGFESLVVDLTEDQEVTLVVDGRDTEAGAQAGPYTLDVELICEPACEDRVCGPDGCGGSCGSCAVPEELCRDDGSCVGPSAAEGDTCASAFPLEVLDGAVTIEGDTRDANNYYGVAAHACAPFQAMGQGSPDQVYILSPEVDTTYRITAVPQGFDAVLYVLSDCGAAQQSCVAASDGTGVERLSLEVKGGQSRYLVVDGTLNTNAAEGGYTLEVAVE